ncbi:cytochrome bd-I oxidase subunit CydX [Methylomagnum ishizawai]|uniref:Cyd operon protein YbgT n=1 Tax=Methylomagnum ishizawai TaxID=1760988 RepID=A0A1Y6D8W4_9GAMM|nr:cytochrome bd-I oxidase subunit CydX [Methylomagnum ishizawai]BBL76365.1 cyd operon protein YbgT [Methylomagnum ishizawai]SMF96664.1 cyd operon protein YbgT [Methylomagnum ishizawai]
MWYFTWILGVGLACAFGIINAMWLEAECDMDHCGGEGEPECVPRRRT